MRRAFTLVELMIVIAVIVSLMAITFRIMNTVGDTEARTITITRMQRLENALSGFHAAFGCYPPVKLHGNRSFRGQEESINWGNESASSATLSPRRRLPASTKGCSRARP